MKVKTYFANEMEAAGRKAQYDSEAKKILSDKTILAWILKYTVRELDGYTVEEIRGFMEEDPEISVELIDGVFHQLSKDNTLVAITADYPGLIPASQVIETEIPVP